MNITTTTLTKPTITPSSSANPPQESSSFGLEFDPFSGVKETFRTAGENAGEFLYAAMPGVGVKAHLQNSFWGSDTRKSTAGAALNLAGTISGVVGLGQLAFGADPTIALGVAAATLGTSGAIYAAVEG